MGCIGWGAFEYIMNDPRFDEIPMVLETIDDTLWAQEIEQLYALQRPWRARTERRQISPVKPEP
ncbi:MAG: hypothetical protein B0D94_10955 [Candidatus Sedimenticola endophacoides]|nr:MAG: hypothetical protein B0D94_10955 [Candidatus Sedimenticola endophacoides]